MDREIHFYVGLVMLVLCHNSLLLLHSPRGNLDTFNYCLRLRYSLLGKHSYGFLSLTVVVEQLPHHLKVEGSSPATAAKSWKFNSKKCLKSSFKESNVDAEFASILGALRL